MNELNLFPIKYVSHRTGLPAYLIRTWESRYSAVSPIRSDSNRRLYHLKDIKRLQLLRKAVKQGHSISQVANLSHDELLGIIKSVSLENYNQKSAAGTNPPSAGSYYKNSLKFIAELDVNGLQGTIDSAAINLTRPSLILEVIVPLYLQTEVLVQTNKLRFINLNMATTILQAFMWDMVRNTVVSESAPKIVIAAPIGPQREILALALALIILESGWKSVYFGSNLPTYDIAAAVESKEAQAVAFLISQFNEQRIVKSEIRKLRKKLDDNIHLLVCVNGKKSMDYLTSSDGVFVTKFEDFRQKLESLTKTYHSNTVFQTNF